MVIGVISDTHDLLRNEALDALRGVDRIIHAGDVGQESILERLAAIAPVMAVRGNHDRSAWTERLPIRETIEAGGVLLHVVHDLSDLDLDPRVASIRLVISGHSHQPSIREADGIVYLNPGSAGPRRFKLPVSVARAEIDAAGAISARMVPLAV